MTFRVFTSLFLALLLALSSVSSAAQSNDIFANQNNAFEQQEPEFLPVEEAFVFDFSQQGDKLLLKWQITPGYYLYKKQFKLVAKRAEIGEMSYPQAREIEDEFFGKTEAYFDDIELLVDIKSAQQDGVVKVRFQGCAEAGLCYPPTVQQVFLSEVSVAGGEQSSQVAAEITSDSSAVSEQDQLKDLLLQSDNKFWALLIFFGLGVGLAFTPCVFPMYPILSGIIVGQGDKLKTGKAFSLSFAYVQGMALTYSILGLVVASAGVQYQAALQHPYVLIPLAILFVILSLSMFGAYEITMPASWQAKLHNASNQQKGGQLLGVFAMGAISGLVASPCTTAPLSGVLLFVAQSGDLVFGGAALYALSLGMGLPLLLIGTSGGKLLPKAGSWMNVVKVTFGFMLIAVSILMLERLIDEQLALVLWAVWLLATFSYFFTVNQSSQLTLWKGVRSFIIFIGLFASAYLGFKAIAPQTGHQAVATESAEHIEFVFVKDVADIEAKVAQAAAQGKYVMLDLYADWCVACKEFEKYTFPDAEVKKRFKDFVLLQADMTENTPETIAIYEQYFVLGLPTMLFFDNKGQEVVNMRVTGFMGAEDFAKRLDLVTAK